MVVRAYGQNTHTRPPERASFRGRRRIGPQVTRKYRAPVMGSVRISMPTADERAAWESDVCVRDILAMPAGCT